MSACSFKCGGRCCEGFFIDSHRPEILGERYLAAAARIIAFEDRPFDWETVFIGEMLIRIDEPDETHPRYTCRHFDAVTRLCRVYDQRPQMCRDYPGYGRGDACLDCGYRNADEVEELIRLARADRQKPNIFETVRAFRREPPLPGVAIARPEPIA